MKKAVFIVQGEGRGHLSQAVALKELFDEAGIRIECIFTGCRKGRSLPAYYQASWGDRLLCFESPWFLLTPNRKGIYIGKTLLFNALRFPRYLAEVRRIRRHILATQPDMVFNFYDVVGALAMRGLPAGIRRFGVGHHFLLHLEDYPCPGGHPWHRRLLEWHTRIVMRACDRILALSFREIRGSGKIQVVPPLVRKAFRQARHEPGERHLVYLLNEGYITDLIRVARKQPAFRADVFSALPTDTPVPEGITLHAIDDMAFLERMKHCQRLVCTAGFDSVAEAASMGIPLVVVPVQNHFEQHCNGKDVVTSGLGVCLKAMDEAAVLDPVKPPPPAFRGWVEQAGEIIINLSAE
jgi:uncharacterized protein (TIGR00661 family)